MSSHCGICFGLGHREESCESREALQHRTRAQAAEIDRLRAENKRLMGDLTALQNEHAWLASVTPASAIENTDHDDPAAECIRLERERLRNLYAERDALKAEVERLHAAIDEVLLASLVRSVGDDEDGTRAEKLKDGVRALTEKVARYRTENPELLARAEKAEAELAEMWGALKLIDDDGCETRSYADCCAKRCREIACAALAKGSKQ